MKRLIGSILLVLLFAMPAFAVHGKYTLERIENAYKEGEIDFDQYIAYKYFAALRTDLLPEEFKGEALAEAPLSGTGFIDMVYGYWDELKPETRVILAQYLPSIPPTSECGGGNGVLGPYDYRFNRYAHPNFEDPFQGEPEGYESPGGYFMIWYKPSLTDEDWVHDCADDLDYIWERYSNTFGWFVNAPEGWHPYYDYYAPDDPENPTPGYEFGPDQYNWWPSKHWDVMMGNLVDWNFDPGILGVTFPMYYDNPQTTRYEGSCYLGLWNQDYPGGSGYPYDETSAHEMHHVIQHGHEMNYKYPGIFVEMSAVASQELIYPDYNNYVDRVNGYLSSTFKWLWTGGGAEYNRPLWPMFFGEKGVRDWGYSHWNEGFINYWHAITMGDEWYRGPDPDIDRTEDEGAGFLYALENGYIDIGDEEDYDTNMYYFKEAFGEFVSWLWFTGSRDDGRWHDGALFNEVNLTDEFADTDLPIVDEDPPGSMRPDSLASNFFLIHGFPSGWEDATIKFLSYIEEDDDYDWNTTRDWGGWVFTESGGTWTTHKMDCPWDNGIYVLENCGSYDKVAFAVYNQTPDDLYERLRYRYSIIEKEESVPPVITLNPVIWTWQPEMIELLITANEQTHGVPDLEITFTPEGEEGSTDRILCEQPDLNEPLFYTTYTQGYGVTGSGTIDVSVYDIYGNEGTASQDFAIANTGTGGVVSIETENIALYIPPGVKGFKGLVAFFEDTVMTEENLISDIDIADMGIDLSTVHSNLNSDESVDLGVLKTSSEGPELLGPAVRILPEWGKLNGCARLTMSYNGVDVTDESKVSIYRLNSNDTWSEVSGGIVNTKNNTITVDITSFGVYAIGLGEGSKVGGGSMIPSSFNLAQNYPNPFDDSTVIKFEIGETTNISLKVYNLAGQLVSTIYEGEKQPGVYTINWDGTDDNGVKLASGLYLYTLEAGSDFKATRKMIMVR